MKKRNFILLTVSLLALLLQSCEEDIIYYKIMGETQGTTYHIIYNKNENLKPQIDSILKVFDQSLSTYMPESRISRINQNEPDAEIDDYIRKVFEKSMEISKASDGMFDITVAPLINAYGFGFTDTMNITRELIDSLMEFVGFDKVKIEGNKIVKTDSRVMLDCNAIAQGYAVDIVAEYLHSVGCDNYMIEIGGEIIVKGDNEYGEVWKLGIDKPEENPEHGTRELQTIIGITDKAVATSGNYRKFYVENGEKYSHSVNPHTGLPVRDNLLSVTIIADNCMTADGYATACMVSGLEKAKELVANTPGLEAYFIYADEKGEFQVYYTEGFEKYISEE